MLIKKPYKPESKKDNETEAKKESRCGSCTALSALAIVAIIGTAIALMPEAPQ